ncbi:MAG: SAM-dependent methyltransferase [Candidatus Lernaella stagnicola]|nr:SAM-dependent methyltransferase [Candidatus Lernaella stagnicola]
MRENQASRTAEYAASFRALETVRYPANVRLFEDPFAVRFLAPSLRFIVRLAGLPLLGALVRGYVDRRWPGAMTSGIARTRLIDDLLLAGVRDDIRQVIVLGAGFDSRAYRLPDLQECRVVEVDHPATQAMKRERMGPLGEASLRHVVFLPADLTKQDLPDVLKNTGLDRNQRTFVLWEGVTHYLGEAAVDATLRALAQAMAPGSRLLFTYLHGGLLDGTVEFDGARASKEQVAGDGEPWIWGMNPEKMPSFLAERGYQLLEDTGATEYRTRYWGERGRRMPGFAFYRVALAELHLGEKR